jgi:hypothetical protein
MSTSVVVGLTSLVAPAHDAGDAERGVAAVGDEQVLGIELPLDVVEGGQRLPRSGPGAPRSSR